MRPAGCLQEEVEKEEEEEQDQRLSKHTQREQVQHRSFFVLFWFFLLEKENKWKDRNKDKEEPR